MEEIIPLVRRFSIGISLEMAFEEFCSLIKEYAPYISHIYFSPPLGKAYHTRYAVQRYFERDGAEKKLFQFLYYAKDSGVNIEMVLNTPGITKDEVIKGIEYIKSKIEIDSLATLNRHGRLVKERLPEVHLVYSYNNGVRTKLELDKIDRVFETVVLGNATIREAELFRYAKKRGFQTILLLNTGCSFNCLWCANSGICYKIFQKNVEKYSPEQLYALQSLFPWELHRYWINNINVDGLKIANRPCTYRYLRLCLDSYINNYDEILIAQNKRDYYLWGRLAHFHPYYDTFDFKRITDCKERIWENPDHRLVMKV